MEGVEILNTRDEISANVSTQETVRLLEDEREYKLFLELESLPSMILEGYERYRGPKSGGFNRVFFMEKDGEVVVIKIPRKPSSSNIYSTSREISNLEARILTSIGGIDKSVPKLMNRGLISIGENLWPYLTMEYVQGEEFGEVMKRKMSEGPLEVARLILSGLESIAYVHNCDGYRNPSGKSIVHNDIKSGNIIVRKCDGKVKLIDFEAASEAFEVQKYFDGTIRLIAPERFLGYPSLPEQDIYSYGITLLNCFHQLSSEEEDFLPSMILDSILKDGHKPKTARDTLKLLEKDEEFQPISIYKLDSTNPFYAILGTMTKIDSRQRYSTVTEAIEEVKEVMRKL